MLVLVWVLLLIALALATVAQTSPPPGASGRSARLVEPERVRPVDAELALRLPVEDRLLGHVAQRLARRHRLPDAGDQADRVALAGCRSRASRARSRCALLGRGRARPLARTAPAAAWPRAGRAARRPRPWSRSTGPISAIAAGRPGWSARTRRAASSAVGMPLSMPKKIVISASPAKIRLRSTSRSRRLGVDREAELAPLVARPARARRSARCPRPRSRPSAPSAGRRAAAACRRRCARSRPSSSSSRVGRVGVVVGAARADTPSLIQRALRQDRVVGGRGRGRNRGYWLIASRSIAERQRLAEAQVAEQPAPDRVGRRSGWGRAPDARRAPRARAACRRPLRASLSLRKV